ncbi:MAG: intradiol ring-cleavage dioxygenase [Streptomyces sp.]|jgi:protocatechuate 3,4-dioxygenase beta subunit|nr:intradiol ring-cleavage dioxygenase [Streptomyces sp.]
MTDSDLTRRRVLALGGAAAGALLGLGIASCSPSSSPGHDSRASGPDDASNAAPDAELCMLNPSTTEGPYYLQGALLRRDITEGKKGVPLTVRLTVRDQPHTCAPLKGAFVEIWQPDPWGYFSGYTALPPGGTVPEAEADTSGANPETYLRGYQRTGADGVAEFRTVFPGWYKSRAPHIYVKVHTGGRNTGRTFEGGRLNWTGQLFFEDRYADAVYAKAPYTEHIGTSARLAQDTVYHGGGERDGLMHVAGNADTGFVATLTVGIDPTRENAGAEVDGESPARPSSMPPSSAPPSHPSPSPPSPTPSPSSAPSGGVSAGPTR